MIEKEKRNFDLEIYWYFYVFIYLLRKRERKNCIEQKTKNRFFFSRKSEKKITESVTRKKVVCIAQYIIKNENNHYHHQQQEYFQSDFSIWQYTHTKKSQKIIQQFLFFALSATKSKKMSNGADFGLRWRLDPTMGAKKIHLKMNYHSVLFLTIIIAFYLIVFFGFFLLANVGDMSIFFHRFSFYAEFPCFLLWFCHCQQQNKEKKFE